MEWKVQRVGPEKVNNPILIEGLPGMGNVGKIAVEYLIEALKAKRLYDFSSNDLPHYVFVNDDNVVELPKIEVYTTKIKGKSIFLLSGDAQPQSEASCYNFCDKLLDTLEKSKGKEIITLGGIALNEEPENPKVYCTGNSKKALKKYGKKKQLQGFVGPIVGVTGLLAGLAKKRKIDAITLLAETYNHPQYIGVKGAQKILEVLNEQLGLKLNAKEMLREFGEEEEKPKKQTKKKKIREKKSKEEKKKEEITDYIG